MYERCNLTWLAIKVGPRYRWTVACRLASIVKSKSISYPPYLFTLIVLTILVQHNYIEWKKIPLLLMIILFTLCWDLEPPSSLLCGKLCLQIHYLHGCRSRNVISIVIDVNKWRIIHIYNSYIWIRIHNHHIDKISVICVSKKW